MDIISFILGVTFGAGGIFYWSKVKQAAPKRNRQVKAVGDFDLSDLVEEKKQTLNKMLSLMVESANRNKTENLSALTASYNSCSNNSVSTSQNLGEILATLEEHKVFISDIEKLSSDASKLAKDSSAQIDRVSQALEKYSHFSQQIFKITDRMNTIDEKSQDISQVGKEAEMLALNAAIEAARAGDAGRGFAVVADSMKELAKNSQDTATEIQQIVSEGSSVIDEVTHGIKQSGDTLTSGIGVFVSHAGEINEFIDKIGSQTKHLDDGFSHAFDQITDLTEQSKTAMESQLSQLTTMIGKIKGLEVHQLDPDEVHHDLGQFDEVIDVRKPEEFTGELGHIEGAKLITLQTEFPEQVKTFDPKKSYLFVCRSGGRSSKAAQMAIEYEIPKVYNLTGGMLEWRKRGY